MFAQLDEPAVGGRQSFHGLRSELRFFAQSAGQKYLLHQDHGCNLQPKTCGQGETVQLQSHGELSTRLEQMELELTNICNSAGLHKCNDWFENPSWLSKIFPRSIVLSLALSIVCSVFVIKPTKV